MKAMDFYRSIAAVLGDDEPGRPFQRYPLPDLIMAYNRGMSVVYKYRPDLFTHIKKVKLTAGVNQIAKGCCDNILDVLSQVDENGSELKTFTGVKTRTTTVKNNWNKPSCLSYKDGKGEDVNFILDYVNIDEGMNSSFTVRPPVPCGVDVYVKVKCVSAPVKLGAVGSDTEMPNSDFHNTAVWHYIIASMLIGDRYATGALAEGTWQMQTFFNLLAIEYKQEVVMEKQEG